MAMARSISGASRLRLAVLGTLAIAALALSRPGAAAEAPPATPPLSDLPAVDRFLSPVGSPEDFSQPAPGEAHGYALTRGMLNHRHEHHLGLDLSNRSAGGQVRAPAAGVVLDAGRSGGWGQLVVIAHRLPGGDLVLSLLAHLQPGSILVKPGQRVHAGEPIGAVGSSGRASGPHLHLEFRRLGGAPSLATLWERAPALDPARILGARLLEAFTPGPGEREAREARGHWGGAYLDRLPRTAKGGFGDPDAPLARREFYAWLARLGAPRPARPSWSAMRRTLERRGLVALPRSRAALAAPVGVDEATGALSVLLSGGFLPGVPAAQRVDIGTLRSHDLVAPTPMLHSGAGPVAGPERPLSRAEGALLVHAARSWPGASDTSQ